MTTVSQCPTDKSSTNLLALLRDYEETRDPARRLFYSEPQPESIGDQPCGWFFDTPSKYKFAGKEEGLYRRVPYGCFPQEVLFQWEYGDYDEISRIAFYAKRIENEEGRLDTENGDTFPVRLEGTLSRLHLKPDELIEILGLAYHAYYLSELQYSFVLSGIDYNAQAAAFLKEKVSESLERIEALSKADS